MIQITKKHKLIDIIGTAVGICVLTKYLYNILLLMISVITYNI